MRHLLVPVPGQKNDGEVEAGLRRHLIIKLKVGDSHEEAKRIGRMEFGFDVRFWAGGGGARDGNVVESHAENLDRRT